MNKKGISPLIATIFLIAVAVALGSIVMSIGQEYVTTTGSGVPPPLCTEYSYEVKAIRYDEDQNSIRISMDNKATRIEGFIIKVFSQDYSQLTTTQILSPLPSYSVDVIEASFDKSTIQTIYEVTIVPLELVGREYVACERSSKTFTQNSAVFRVE